MEHHILIDGAIGREPGELSASWFKSQLSVASGSPICVTINSEGGSIFEALTIFDLIQGYKGSKRCIIENAFSMGSALACAFPVRHITQSGYVMLHNPYVESGDEPSVLSQLRTKLAQIYSAATRKPLSTIFQWMDCETFMDSSESIRNGFVGSIVEASVRANTAFQAMLRRDSRFRACIVARLGKSTPPTSWKDVVRARMANGLDFGKAAMAVEKEHPGLRQRYIAEYNKR